MLLRASSEELHRPSSKIEYTASIFRVKEEFL
jgi:hypothetical protein